MTQARHTWTVAGWEFRRYFKWKDQILGLVVFLAISGLALGAGLVVRSRGSTVRVAVSDVELAPLPDGRLRFEAATPADSLRLREGTIHGMLRRTGSDAFVLNVRREPTWRPELERVLAAHLQRERLQASGVSSDLLTQLLAPPALDVRYPDGASARRGPGEKIVAGILTAILLLTIFTSMAYLLTGITSEKQLRVTESVIAAISPQAWIDGKVLGLTAYALTTTLNMIAGSLLVALAARFAWEFAIPQAAVRPAVLAGLLIFCVLGLLLWNSFFAAIAATIDDPNTSARSSFMLLPMLPVALCAPVLRDPDSLLSRGLALFPLTSVPAMPARMVVTDPAIREILLSAAFLVLAIGGVRRAAGHIFEIGMLMYGKEPTVREMLRWARRR